jgi:hypothetical protein
MYGIFTYIWAIYGVNGGEYSKKPWSIWVWKSYGKRMNIYEDY